MVELTEARFASILEGFESARIAVVGDYFLDKYLIIDPALAEPSLETGLEACQVVDRRMSPGAAGTVVSNLQALGVGHIHLVGVIGDDGEGYELIQRLEELDVNTTHLLEDPEIFTPTYTKPMVIQPDGSRQEDSRIDIINRDPLPDRLLSRIAEAVEELTSNMDAVIIADQVEEEHLGVIAPQVRSELCQVSESHPGCIFFADSRAHIGQFPGMRTKPNIHEGAGAVGMNEAAPAEKIVRALYEMTGEAVFLTLGERGMCVYDGDEVVKVPGCSVSGPIDIVGAGDSATAGIVPALGAGASAPEAAVFGNLAASITIQQIGQTGTASPEQLQERFVQYRSSGEPTA